MLDKIITLKNKILTLCLIVIALFVIKPTIAFTPNGKVRQYGVGVDSDGYKKTLYTFSNIIIMITVLIYMIK